MLTFLEQHPEGLCPLIYSFVYICISEFLWINTDEKQLLLEAVSFEQRSS